MLRKILAVDDSALIHQMYKLFLSRYKNCKLISAMNGLEALDKLGQEEGIDLILLDINMPVMNGLEFLQRVQKEPAYQAIPVIIISTEGKEEDTIRGPEDGRQGIRQEALPGLRAARPHREDHGRRYVLMSDFQVSAELLDHLPRGRPRPPGGPGPLPADRWSATASIPRWWPGVLGPLHTLKGNSGMMGFTAIKEYVHRLEDVFAQHRGRRAQARRPRPSTGSSRAPAPCATRWSRPAARAGEVRDLAAEKAALDTLLRQRRGGARRRPAWPRRPRPRARRQRRRSPAAAARARRVRARSRPSTWPPAPARCAWTSPSSTTC